MNPSLVLVWFPCFWFLFHWPISSNSLTRVWFLFPCFWFVFPWSISSNSYPSLILFCLLFIGRFRVTLNVYCFWFLFPCQIKLNLWWWKTLKIKWFVNSSKPLDLGQLLSKHSCLCINRSHIATHHENTCLIKCFNFPWARIFHKWLNRYVILDFITCSQSCCKIVVLKNPFPN